MITTKRQIRTNDDRYMDSADGDIRMNTSVADDIRSDRELENVRGFDRHNDFTDIRMDAEPAHEFHQMYDVPSMAAVDKMPVIEAHKTAEEMPKSMYTTRETLKTELPPRPVKERDPHSVEDVMPSLKTLHVAERRADVTPTDKTVAAERTAARTNLSPKMKVALIVCLAIAIVLAIAVIATGVSISSAAAETEALAQEIATKQVVIAEQQATIADLTSDSTLRDEAIAHGMVSADDPEYTATRAEKSDYPEATPHTNAFDSFCDWLGGIIN